MPEPLRAALSLSCRRGGRGLQPPSPRASPAAAAGSDPRAGRGPPPPGPASAKPLPPGPVACGSRATKGCRPRPPALRSRPRGLGRAAGRRRAPGPQRLRPQCPQPWARTPRPPHVPRRAAEGGGRRLRTSGPGGRPAWRRGREATAPGAGRAVGARGRGRGGPGSRGRLNRERKALNASFSPASRATPAHARTTHAHHGAGPPAPLQTTRTRAGTQMHTRAHTGCSADQAPLSRQHMVSRLTAPFCQLGTIRVGSFPSVKGCRI